MQHTRVKPDVTGTGFRRPSFRPLRGSRAFCGWMLLLLLLGWGSASPARAISGTIDYATSELFTVGPGETLNIVAGAEISGSIFVFGGTLNVYGGKLYFYAQGNTIENAGGTANIYGCNLRLDGLRVTGTLQDGSALNTSAVGVTLVNQDTGPLQLTCPPEQVVQAAPGAGCTNVDPGTATASDGCSTPPLVTAARSDGASLSDPYPLGTTIITWTATDGFHGNTSSNQTIVVNGSGATPTIALNGANPLAVECHTAFTDPGATATLCGFRQPVTTRGSVDPDTPGTYTLTYSTTDAAGDTASTTRTINVVDTRPPMLIPPQNIVQVVDPGQCSAHVDIGTATATDACAGAVTPVARRADGKPLTDPFPISPPGSMGNLVIWTATDAFGNQDIESQAVYVIKTDPPTVTLNGSDSMTVTCHGSFIDPGATAIDTCAGSLPVTTNGSVDLNTPGTYTLTYSATNPYYDSIGTATRTVTVVDTTPPVVTPPADINRPSDPGQCSAQVNVGMATATDTCAGTLTPAGARSDGKPLTEPYPVGMTTITWKANDLAGNQAAATQTVIVTDQQPPTLACPANVAAPATSTSGTAVSFTVGATDNCSVASLVCTNQGGQVVTSGSTFPIGTSTVTCRATDAAGNQGTCSFTITVTPPTADLSLTMSGSPNPLSASGNTNLTYMLGVTNNGPHAAQGVVVTDPLPAGTSFASAATKAGTLTTPKGSGAGTVTWSVGTLQSGQSATLTLVVKVTAKAGATINNIASVSAGTTSDPNPGNNSATVSTPVTKS